MIGIYKITSPTNKVYIGQSIDIERRFRAYSSNGAKGQPALDNSFNKYGVKAHEFEIIMPLKSPDRNWLNYWERYFIKYFKTIGEELLNITDGGVNCEFSEESRKVRSLKYSGAGNPRYGKPQSEETKNKIRQKALGRRFSKEVNKKKGRPLLHSIPILQLSIDGTIIKQWESAKLAEKTLGISNVSMSCRYGKPKTSGGFKWKYA